MDEEGREAKGQNPEMVAVYSSDDSFRVDLLRTRLEDAGIPARVSDHEIVSMDWMLSTAVGGIKLLVPADRAEEAVKLLEDVLARPGAPAGGDACPACGSDEVAFRTSQRFVFFLIFLSFFTGGLSLLVLIAWWVIFRPRLPATLECLQCGEEWEGKK